MQLFLKGKIALFNFFDLLQVLLKCQDDYTNRKIALILIFFCSSGLKMIKLLMLHLYLIYTSWDFPKSSLKQYLDPQQARSYIRCQIQQAAAARGCSVWHQLKMIAVKIKLKGQRPTWLLALNSPCRRKLLLEPRAISEIITTRAYYNCSTF